MAINGIKSALRTLNDETATTGEKITAVLMGISMAVPGIIGAYSKLGSVINGVVNAMAAEGALTTASIARHSANAISVALVGAGYDKKTASVTAAVIADNAELFTTKALESENGKLVAVMALTLAGINHDTAVKIVDAIATGNLTVANLALKASMIEIVAIIAIVAAAIAGIILLYKKW